MNLRQDPTTEEKIKTEPIPEHLRIDYNPKGIYPMQSAWDKEKKKRLDLVWAQEEKKKEAAKLEEQKRLITEADMYAIEKHWLIFGPKTAFFHFAQPWVIGYSGESPSGLGQSENYTVIARLWIDSELKEAMGR